MMFHYLLIGFYHIGSNVNHTSMLKYWFYRWKQQNKHWNCRSHCSSPPVTSYTPNSLFIYNLGWFIIFVPYLGTIMVRLRIGNLDSKECASNDTLANYTLHRTSLRQEDRNTWKMLALYNSDTDSNSDIRYITLGWHGVCIIHVTHYVVETDWHLWTAITQLT